MAAVESRPIDPARLALLREPDGCACASPELVKALLDDRDYQAQRADAAEANYRFMVERSAGGGRLDGYRELGQRAADAERERDEARAEVARLRSRVRVEAEDVARAGVTLAHVHAWERANGHRTSVVNKRSDEHALARGRGHGPVSYTHLTLPTNSRV